MPTSSAHKSLRLKFKAFVSAYFQELFNKQILINSLLELYTQKMSLSTVFLLKNSIKDIFYLLLQKKWR